jgi:undecaprenyl-diphosphatase
MAFTSGLTWIPLYVVLFYLVLKNNETMAQIMLVIGCVALCILLTSGIDGGIVKPLVARCRPSNDPQWKYTFDVVQGYRAAGFSFFSAHAANTMGVAVFFCFLIRSRMLSVTLVLWALLNGWTRLYLGLHYPSDVLVGWAFGALAGFLVYLLYRRMYYKISPKLNYISSQYTKTGYDHSDIDVVMTVLAFTLVYTLFRGIISNY